MTIADMGFGYGAFSGSSGTTLGDFYDVAARRSPDKYTARRTNGGEWRIRTELDGFLTDDHFHVREARRFAAEEDDTTSV